MRGNRRGHGQGLLEAAYLRVGPASRGRAALPGPAGRQHDGPAERAPEDQGGVRCAATCRRVKDHQGTSDQCPRGESYWGATCVNRV